MTSSARHLFASVRRPYDFRPTVTAIVLYGLQVEGEDVPMYLEIRFIDYENLQIDGDHLMSNLQEAVAYARSEYGILPDDWRDMTKEEIERIPW